MSDLISLELGDMRKRLKTLESLEVSNAKGTVFPTGIAAGTEFFRTDLGWHCYYDGTRWLTVHEYHADIPPVGDRQPWSSDTNGTSLGFGTIRTDYGIYVTTVVGYYSVATTNNTSNYWVSEITLSGTIIATHSTQNDAVGNIYKSTTVDTAYASGQTYLQLRQGSTTDGKVGAPGALRANATVYYRLVVP